MTIELALCLVHTPLDRCSSMTIKLVFLTVFFSIPSFATVYHWPEVCEDGTLIVQNLNSIESRFFIQTFNSGLKDEEQFIVGPYQKLKIPVSGPTLSHPHRRKSLLTLESHLDNFKISFQCGSEIYQASPLQSGQWTFKKKVNLFSHKIWIKNITTKPAIYTVSTYDSRHSLLKTWTLQFQSNEQKSIVLKESDQWSYFKFSADTRATIFYLDHYKNIEPVQFNAFSPRDVDENGVYFEVQNREKNDDSFVIHLTDPVMIEKARSVLANPKSEKIVVGEVKAGFGNHNINLNSRDRAPWSWHVSRVSSFSDFGSTACNGLPQIVEDRAESWVQDPGRICFWTYRLKREISPVDF
jgi:hypothetical protein